VGNLGTVSLRVSSGTTLPIFIEIGSYLTDKEQKISWHSFLRHGVYVHACFLYLYSASTTLIIAITKNILSASLQTWDSACHSTLVRFFNMTFFA